ncbi:hypothetical protein [Streptomyces africanus]|uniref:hypothetical protein n=1 Tax=Streptomyces africanus TaxID=231024 RepID=UPI000A3ABA2A|nr:hypothetical protein [Streptomyces africanus]
MPDLNHGDDVAAVNSLRSAVMRLSRRLKHQRVDESLSPTEMSVLGTLSLCGRATPGELARKRNAFLASLVENLDEDEWATLRAAAPVLEKLAHL